jgi:hypothetical protein
LLGIAMIEQVTSNQMLPPSSLKMIADQLEVQGWHIGAVHVRGAMEDIERLARELADARFERGGAIAHANAQVAEVERLTRERDDQRLSTQNAIDEWNACADERDRLRTVRVPTDLIGDSRADRDRHIPLYVPRVLPAEPADTSAGHAAAAGAVPQHLVHGRSAAVTDLSARGLRSVAELADGRPHGTRLRYLAGCKCFQCRRANSDYERQRQAARLAGDWNGIVDAAPARRHMAALSRAGVGRRAVRAATDVADTVLQDIRAGRRLRIRARTERKIMAVTAAARSDHSLVPAKKTWRLITELLHDGYSKRQLAKRLGYADALQFSRDRVTAKNELRVSVLHRKLTT